MTAPKLITGIDLPLEPSCGSMIFCSDLYHAMADRFRTTFLALPPADPTWRHGFSRTLYCQAPKAPYGPGFPTYVDALTDEVRDHLAEQRPDAIHAQHLGFGLALAFVRAAGRLPVVAIAHGTDVIAAEESELARATLTEIVARATTVVAPNYALGRRIDALADHQHTDKITIVPWGIPLHQVQRDPEPSPDGTLRLLHAGRLDANKSTITAVEAMALTTAPHELTIIGSGSELDTLKRRTHTLGLDDRVHFTPFTPRHSLWKAFADFDAFLFTTAGTEAFGLVAVEAQDHGLLVAYADITGMGETLGGAGYPYPPGDPQQLATAIDKMTADHEAHHALRARGLANAARYAIADSADQMAAVTRQAIGAAA